jgi:hypothetical protein
MRTTIIAVYVLMAVWLIFASAGRIAITIAGNDTPDWIPYTSFGIGITAILILMAAYEKWLNNSDQ